MAQRLSAGLVVLSLVWVGLACSSQGSVLSPLPAIPVVVGVSPTGVIGQPGESIQLTASASGNPTRWEWSFSAGVEPSTSTEPTPQVTTDAEGDYSGSVVACNAGGCSAAFGFAFSIQEAPTPGTPERPVVSGVSPSGSIGGVGATITLTPTASNRPTSWEWTFGPGIDPSTSNAATPSITLLEAGNHTGTVRACNAAGCSETLTFPLVAGDDSVPYTWATFPTGIPVGARDIGVGTEHLWIAWLDATTNHLRMSRSADLTPISMSDWTTHTADINPALGFLSGIQAIKLLVTDSQLLLSWEVGALPGMVIAMSTDTEPDAADDWTQRRVSSLHGSDWAVLDGRPAMLMHPFDPDLFEIVAIDLHWARETSAHGAADWEVRDVMDEFQVLGQHLLVQDGRFCFVAQTSGIAPQFVGAQTADPQGVADWATHALPLDLSDTTGFRFIGQNLVTFQGRLVGAMGDRDNSLLVSNAGMPTSTADWTVVDPSLDTGTARVVGLHVHRGELIGLMDLIVGGVFTLRALGDDLTAPGAFQVQHTDLQSIHFPANLVSTEEYVVSTQAISGLLEVLYLIPPYAPVPD